MEDQQQFKQLLNPIRRGLLIKQILKELQLLLLLAGACVFLLMAFASFMVVPFLHYYFLAMIAVFVVIFFIRIWKNRPTSYDAALIYNEFVSEDRVLTAFSFLGKAGDIEKLQLADAVSCMKKVQQTVLKRKKRLWFPKWIMGGCVLAFAGIVLFYTVPEKFELAGQQEKQIKLVKQVEKKLTEQAKKEKKPEVKKALKEALKKVSQKKSAEEALKELEKQSKKLELKALLEKEKQKALSDWQENLKQNDLANLANLLDQKNMQAIEKELKKLNKNWNELNKDQQKALSQLSQKENQLTDEELAQLMKQIEKALQSPELLKQLASAQAAIQNTGMSLQKQMAANGMPPSVAFAPQGQTNGGQGSQSGKGQTPSQGGNNGNKSGNGSGSGNGVGNGSGSGSGSGSGTGSGSGSGSGNGSGQGGGAGLGQGSRDLLTIPERMKGNTNMETDVGQLGEGKQGQQSDGTGPVLKGNIRPYEEVYGEYEKSYRQSTERYPLPADLENIVKNYFSTIDPNKE